MAGEERPKKRVDESWKEQAQREKHVPSGQQPQPGQPTTSAPEAGTAAAERAPEAGTAAAERAPEARFDLFISSLAMEALIALGDMPHPTTRAQSTNLSQAKYLIDLLGILEQKTAGNLHVDEEKLFKDTLYQLRMRYLAKGGGA